MQKGSLKTNMWVYQNKSYSKYAISLLQLFYLFIYSFIYLLTVVKHQLNTASDSIYISIPAVHQINYKML